jgi:hypothetical protein
LKGGLKHARKLTEIHSQIRTVAKIATVDAMKDKFAESSAAPKMRRNKALSFQLVTTEALFECKPKTVFHDMLELGTHPKLKLRTSLEGG